MNQDRIAKIKELMQEQASANGSSSRALPNTWKPARLIRRITTDSKTQSWLTTPDSLTAKLKQSCPELQVRVLSEAEERPLLDEAKALNLHPQATAWVRCVLLKCGEQDWVYARTIIPNLTDHNPWQNLQNLGNKPLGEVLFELPSIQRSTFEFSKQPLKNWPYLKTALGQTQPKDIGYSRRSVFQQQKHPLLLTEVFLPGLLSFNHTK